jgi:hypothetical protein
MHRIEIAEAQLQEQEAQGVRRCETGILGKGLCGKAPEVK